MPSKGSHYKSGKRDLIIDKEFCNNLRKETGLDLDDRTIKDIIESSNKEMANIVANSEEGLKLPENLGYIVVTKYKTTKHPVDWVNSKRLKKTILLPNLHSFGYIHHIKWFKRGLTNFAFGDVYRLVPTRLLQREVAKNIKEGKTYDIWTTTDFWSRTKTLRKLYNT